MRARRAFTLFNHVLLRTRRAQLLYEVWRHRPSNQKGTIAVQSLAIATFWFSTENLWTALMPFSLSADELSFSLTILEEMLSSVSLQFKSVQAWTYYIARWFLHLSNGSLSLITWPPPPDNVHLDEHIHVSWQCWLRNHESSLTKGPFTSLRIHFAEVPFQDTYLDWEPVDEDQRTQNYENVCDIRLLQKRTTGGHASDLA